MMESAWCKAVYNKIFSDIEVNISLSSTKFVG
jgi:hypothetical protein